MQKIVTVTANAALDWTCFVAGLRLGERNLERAGSRQAGGKGVNVARVLATLGVPVRCVVLVAGTTGREILRDLENSRLEAVAVEARGESRTCLEIIDEESGDVTQIHGAGADADDETAAALVAVVESTLDDASWLALCGSLAPGLPSDLYAKLIQVARSRGVRVALDSSETALLAGLRAGVDLLRINRDEAAAFGDVGSGLRAECDRHARMGILSDGSREIAAWTSDQVEWRVTPPLVRVRNSIGCGDTMLAGLLARLNSTSREEALRFATALASASAESRSIGGDCVARALELAESINVHRVRGAAVE